MIGRMGKIKTFEIHLEDNKAVYSPGELVKGRCNLDLKSDLKLRAFRIFMRGLAKVHWTESRSTGTRLGTYTEHYNAEVEYFHKKILLFGSENQEDRDSLCSGHHDFDFTFELPSQGIATSFEGKHGNIRYWLKAEMDIPWSLNHKCKKAFTVISPIDINRSEYQLPIEHSIEKSLCCWLCISGPISIVAKTDRKGYCPGESVAISADFENHSSRTIIPYATLHQNQTYLASGKTRLRSTKFTSLTGLPISSGNRATWDAQLLKIHAISPSVIDCNLIKVDYYVKVALHIPGAYNLAVHLPIVIGTVPYRRATPYFVTQRRVIQNRSQVFYENQLVPSPPPYQETELSPPHMDDPPTYVESYEGPVDIADEDDDDFVSYTPMYRYVFNYQFRQPPAYSEIDPHGNSMSDQPTISVQVSTNTLNQSVETISAASQDIIQAIASTQTSVEEVILQDGVLVSMETETTRL